MPEVVSESKGIRLAEVFGPWLLAGIGGVGMFVALQTRMDIQTDTLKKLEDVPIQLVQMESSFKETTARLQIDQSRRYSELGQRVSGLEEHVERNEESLRRNWDTINEVRNGQ